MRSSGTAAWGRGGERQRGEGREGRGRSVGVPSAAGVPRGAQRARWGAARRGGTRRLEAPPSCPRRAAKVAPPPPPALRPPARLSRPLRGLDQPRRPPLAAVRRAARVCNVRKRRLHGRRLAAQLLAVRHVPPRAHGVADVAARLLGGAGAAGGVGGRRAGGRRGVVGGALAPVLLLLLLLLLLLPFPAAGAARARDLGAAPLHRPRLERAEEARAVGLAFEFQNGDVRVLLLLDRLQNDAAGALGRRAHARRAPRALQAEQQRRHAVVGGGAHGVGGRRGARRRGRGGGGARVVLRWVAAAAAAAAAAVGGAPSAAGREPGRL
jgi:hypothetical protein